MKKTKHFRQILLLAAAVFVLAAGAQAQPCPPQPFASQTISSNTTYNDTTLYMHQITINNNATLTLNNCHIYFDNYGEILVNGTSTLIADSTVLTYCHDDYIWKGITAGKDATVIIRNNSLIKNAFMGVCFNGGNSATGSVSVLNSTIKNCSYGIYMSNLLTTNTSNFHDSHFIIDDDNMLYKSNDVFMCHIRAYNSSCFAVTNCEFANNCTHPLSKSVYFQGKGIETFCTPFYINSLYGDTIITRTSFSNFPTAVDAMNNASTSISVQKSDFVNNWLGVKSNNTNGSTISHNNFDIATVSTALGSNYGICMIESDLFSITNNYISRTNVNSISCNGISVCDGGTSDKFIKNNNISELNCGIYTEGVNGGTYGTNGPYKVYSGLHFRCNRIHECIFGVFNASGHLASPQGIIDAVLGNCSAENTFTNTYMLDIQNDGYPFIYFYRGTAPSITSNVSLVSTHNNGCIFARESGTFEEYQNLKGQLNDEFIDTSYLDAILYRMYEIEGIALNNLYYNMSMGGDKLDSISMWYDAIDRYDVKYALVEVLQGMGEYTQAKTKLMSIPQNFVLNAEQHAEHSTYVNFFNLQEAMRAAGRYWDNMTSDDVSILMQIAEYGTGRAKTMARNILCFFENFCYEDVITEESNTKKYSHGPITRQGDDEVILYPNPTTDKVNIKWNHEGAVDLYVYSLDGTLKTKVQQVKTETEIDMSRYERGVYIFHIFAKDSIHAGKIIKY